MTKERLNPLDPIKRELLVLSGNRCSFTGCPSTLLQGNRSFVGEFAHIEAAEPNGPRYRKGLAPKDRAAAANLILVCRNHHKIIDTEVETYTVAKLKAMKKAHEAGLQNDTARLDAVRGLVTDITKGTVWEPPLNLLALQPPDPRISAADRANDVEGVARLAAYLADVPEGARPLIAMVIKRGEPTPHATRTEAKVDFTILKAYSGLGNRTLIDHAKVLEHKRLGHFNDAEYGEPASIEIYGSSEHVGWEFFLAMTDAGLPPETVDRAVQDLEFTALDA